MSAFTISLVLATLLCSLVAGFLFAYAVVVMPGLRDLDDRQFIRAFQVTDRVIQDNNPLFILVWVGSAIAVIACVVTGALLLEGTELVLLLFATVIYLTGVQISTIAVHLPLNNKLQQLNVDDMSDHELQAARVAFEPRWNNSNRIRTAIACMTAVTLITLNLLL